MEEKELFEQIKPLIEEYKEYANQETPDLFNDFRANSLSKVEEKNYGTDREGEILKTLDEGKMYDKKRDDVIAIPYQIRKELIEELVEIREAKKEQMRSTIFEKVSTFINDSREKMNQEIEAKKQDLEEQKEAKRKNLEEKQQKLSQKEQLKRDMNKRSKVLTKHLRLIEQDLGKSDKVYRGIEEEQKQVIRDKKGLSRDINALTRECEALKLEYEDFDIESDEKLQELVKNLSDFEQIYGKVNFESEEGLDYIEIIIANYEEKETTRMSNGQVFVNDEPVEDMGTIIDMEENQILKEEFEQRIAEIEAGNEDLIEMLPPDYVLSKIELTEKQDIEDALKFLEGKKLLDILQEQAVQFEENSDERKKYESVIEKIIQREKQKEEKTVGQQPTGQQPSLNSKLLNGVTARDISIDGEDSVIEEKHIKNVSIGKKIVITYSNEYDTKKTIGFREVKRNLDMSSEEKIELIKILEGKERNWERKQKLLDNIDANYVYALLEARRNGVNNEEVNSLFKNYVRAIMGKREEQDKTREVLTYDRTGMRFKNLLTFIPVVFTRNKEYKKLIEISKNARGMAQIIEESYKKRKKMKTELLEQPAQVDKVDEKVSDKYKVDEETMKGLQGVVEQYNVGMQENAAEIVEKEEETI